MAENLISLITLKGVIKGWPGVLVHCAILLLYFRLAHFSLYGGIEPLDRIQSTVESADDLCVRNMDMQ